ncbi:ATPase, T2SS/T4P/T4SS family [Paucibacter soli]|uniref:ATPase, T2SS/T4P/T4SS family n=1 Tax=Paucibacter soli TaxID=3133433 RepID=UPI0030A0D83D
MPEAVSEVSDAGLTFRDVTDWYIPEDDGLDVLVYPGAIKADGGLRATAHKLRDDAVWRHSQDTSNPRDWKAEYEGLTFRVHRQSTVGGTLYIFRKMSTELPVLGKLGIPPELVRILSWQNFGDSGGLVIVSGGPGQGKSTTNAAILVERVRRFGYFCLTVEDPPEFAMHGEYPSRENRIGQVIQVPAKSESFAHELKDALRCYPSNMRGSMLMVGEVRDGQAAGHVLRAAVNGQLVFTTLHAGDPIAALERMLALAKDSMGQEEACSLLAHSLRAVIHQKLQGGKLSVSSLLSMRANSSVAANIRRGALPQLSTELDQQKTLLARGNDSLINSLLEKNRTGAIT